MTKPFFDDAARNLFDEIFAETLQEVRQEQPWSRLHRAMYVLSMHKGRPHAVRPAFQRKWLTEAMTAIQEILDAMPEEDTT